MYLKNLSIVNFKNYGQAELSFSERINCFVGSNGVGKTNILDSIYYLSLTKSYFNAVDSQNIKYHQDFSVIQGEFCQGEKTDVIYCGLQKNKKKLFKKNKKDYQRLAEHIGYIPLVMVSPADSSLIMDGGEERRKFLNGVISQYDKTYLEQVINYNRILAQRNKYLKTLNGSSQEAAQMLDVYDEQLITLGEEIFNRRNSFVEELIPVFKRVYASIAGEKEEVGLNYRSQLAQHTFSTLLNDNRKKDCILQYTSSGIHRDDLEMKLAGYSLKKSGSQGQQKTYQMALKLGKFEFIRQASGKTPILLLDDVFDKFDHQRMEHIIRLVSENNFGQIFITDTDENRIRSILERIGIENRVFKIDDNQDIRQI